MRRELLIGCVLLASCGRPADSVAPVEVPIAENPTPSDDAASEANLVRWTQVARELETLICMVTFEIEGKPPIQEPVYGRRDACKLPPAASPLERAIEQAYADASDLLAAMRHEWGDSVRAALADEEDPEARLAAARQAYLYDRFVAVLMMHVVPALEAEGLTCTDCPAPYSPSPRSVTWDVFAPYVAAYAWPDSVVTPTDARGRATGKPKYSMHVCAGINGISEMSEVDDGLVELGFLAVRHTSLFIERAPKVFAELRKDPVFGRLKDDESRTRWLRDELGPRLTSDPEVRAALCETVKAQQWRTGIEVTPCDAPDETPAA